MKQYTNEDIEYLKTYYPRQNQKEIVNNLGRSWNSIQKKAHKLKINRELYTSKNNNKFKKLCEDSVESSYWLGFLIADGHFNKNKFITLNLQKKDIVHLNLFRKFLSLPTSDSQTISISDQVTFLYLTNLYEISSRKTYNPCNLEKLKNNKDLFFSFIIGFIDGDGSINEKGEIRIKCHSSWLKNMEDMLILITNNDYHKPKINKEGLSVAYINKIEIVKKIYMKINDLKIPYLKRKWSKIPLNKLSKKEKRENMELKCIELLNKGVNINEIIKETNYSQSFIYQTIKKRDSDRSIKIELQ